MTSSPRLSGFQAALLAVVFAVVGLTVAWPSLDYEWHWDDLHLIRTYSASEIRQSFFGSWDPDGIETKGFRPVTLIYNDLRARMFGESVRAHRLFLIGLYSLYLVLLAGLVVRLGGPWWAGLLGGVLTLCAKDSFYHYVWISDGIHLVPGLLFIGAAHLLFTYLDTNRRWLAALSAVLVLIALAAREDALAAYPALLLVGIAYLWFSGRPYQVFLRLVPYAVLLAVTFLPFWIWRLVIIPSAPNFRANTGVLVGPLKLFFWTVSLSGQSGPARYGFAALAALLLVVACLLPRAERRQSLLWLLLAAVACLPGAVRVVPNLLFLAISFYATFAALTIAMAVRRWRLTIVPAVLIVAVTLVLSVRASRLEQYSLHPMSADKIYRDWEVIYSKLRFSSTPPVRVQHAKEKLARFGIVDDTFDFTTWQRDMRERGRVGFVDDGQPFVPEKYFLTP